ncbi:hypothetical protein NW762_006204 [Fusarium torreyae]|uniref:Uncharacterized protein n=1 Tax=Fusarium torreyae TaxID=1237075 RepID=A0A9W8S307_9HYPO|nr:hypothetical protein NW762_006204 [Fusarium torreyae]
MPLSAIKGFFQSRFFEPQWKNKVFIAQVGMTTIAFCLGIAKLATKPSQIPMSRMDIMAITMSIKSFAFLAYEYFTEKVDRLKRFGSLKAYAILNTLDILFWMVVMGLTFSGVSRICIGANCGIGVLVALAALLNAFIHFWAAVIAWKNHVYFKRFGVPRGQDVPQSKSTIVGHTTIGDTTADSTVGGITVMDIKIEDITRK